MKKILIVEDTPHHMKEAIEAAQKAGFEIVTATCSLDARQIMSREKVDGVVTDIFMPFANQAPWNHSDDPCGLDVMLEAEGKNIPFVICTSGNHHGARYEWINSLSSRRGWTRMVDSSSDYHTEAPSKDWGKAMEYLTELL